MEQLSLAESLWEAGLDKCLYGPKRCPYRPCTAAQEVFCCRKCRHYGICQSGCGKDGKDGKTTERVLLNYKTEVTENGVTVNIEQVNLVTCEECIHKEKTQPGMVYCPYIIGSWVPNGFFCGHGEREVQE